MVTDNRLDVGLVWRDGLEVSGIMLLLSNFVVT